MWRLPKKLPKKQFKRAGLSTHHLLHYYGTVIHALLDYCVLVWHYALAQTQTEQLEAAVQKRAIHTFLGRISHVHGLSVCESV